MERIWSGGYTEDNGKDMSGLLTAEDNIIDSNLVKHEILGLVAYHLEISRASLIPAGDSRNIMGALLKLYESRLSMEPGFEDVHSLIDSKVRGITESGSNLRIFLSRNDQSHYDIRSFYMDSLLRLSRLLLKLSEVITARLGGVEGCTAGYTHYRQAMPVAMSTYFDYLASVFLSLSRDSIALFDKFSEHCPLGYGSGYGTALDLDMDSVARNLGFQASFKNPMDGAFYRGADDIEMISLETRIMNAISRVAQDMILLSSEENGFMILPHGFTTGSSLMPNKRNPDFLEMLQGFASESLGILTMAVTTTMNKGSGYHREFQLSKDKVIAYTSRMFDILSSLEGLFTGLGINVEKAHGLMLNSINATMEAFSLFRNGTRWKDAYRAVGERLQKGERLGIYETKSFKAVSLSTIKMAQEEISKKSSSRDAAIVRTIELAHSLAVGSVHK